MIPVDKRDKIPVPNWPEKMDALRHLRIQIDMTHARQLDLQHVPIFAQIVSVLPPYLPEVITIGIMSHGEKYSMPTNFDGSLLCAIHRQIYDRSLVDVFRKHCRLTGARGHFEITAVYEQDDEIGATDEERYRMTEDFISGFSDLHRIPKSVVKVSVLRQDLDVGKALAYLV